MATKESKRLPYGISNFESIMTENYAYVDKTRFVEQLEKHRNSNLFSGCTDVRYLSLIFIGKDKFEIEEL
jgi:hypothetical protein